MPLLSVQWPKIATRCFDNPCKINALIPLHAGATLIWIESALPPARRPYKVFHTFPKKEVQH
jgi:hypothetical protein